MKKILAGAAALLGTAVSAQAADMAVKAPYLKAPVAMVYDWTGFYIGVNAGVGLGRDYTRLAVPAGPSFEASYLGPQGGLGGGQVGYNYQTSGSFFGGPLVFGVEADIQGTGMRDSLNCGLGCPGPAASSSVFNQRLDWFGTARARVGIATGPVLSYVTGGFAYGNVKTSLTETVGPGVGVFATSQNKGGWTIGSGVEVALGGNWTGKIEYLYLNLGDRLDLFTLNGAPQALSTDIRENIFRVGLNYRVNGGSNYVAPPPANWAGFYLGGNVGGATARDRSVLAIPSLAINERFNPMVSSAASRPATTGRRQIGCSVWRPTFRDPAKRIIAPACCPAIRLRLSRPTMRPCPGSALPVAVSAIRRDRHCSTPPAVTPMATSRPSSHRQLVA
jgi:outer membrane immunogenic protein